MSESEETIIARIDERTKNIEAGTSCLPALCQQVAVMETKVKFLTILVNAAWGAIGVLGIALTYAFIGHILR